ncbi:hypothetical protein M885DRAFT_543684 [Pelagophyceae sp. CCMP2097]|nr:hypothetical protein M885DRAFT_543684 [Pelagophyceae sp. CCMP2097]
MRGRGGQARNPSSSPNSRSSMATRTEPSRVTVVRTVKLQRSAASEGTGLGAPSTPRGAPGASHSSPCWSCATPAPIRCVVQARTAGRVTRSAAPTSATASLRAAARPLANCASRSESPVSNRLSRGAAALSQWSSFCLKASRQRFDRRGRRTSLDRRTTAPVAGSKCHVAALPSTRSAASEAAPSCGSDSRRERTRGSSTPKAFHSSRYPPRSLHVHPRSSCSRTGDRAKRNAAARSRSSAESAS